MRPWIRLPAVTLTLVLVFLVDVSCVTHVAATSLTPEAQRGQHIYRRGSSPAGYEMNAVLEPAGVAVPAAVLPCVNCHGHDGRGRAEGGVTPADISWQTLT